jgi:hypothetical protein
MGRRHSLCLIGGTSDKVRSGFLADCIIFRIFPTCDLLFVICSRVFAPLLTLKTWRNRASQMNGFVLRSRQLHKRDARNTD